MYRFPDLVRLASVSEANSPKVVRSYRLVFRRRWRIFRIQGWRIPLPGGIELRLLAYWLASLALIALLGRLPLLGTLISAAPASLRLLALPIAAAWLLSRWEIDGRPPHRALLGLLGLAGCVRAPLAALRRVPPPGTELAPLASLSSPPTSPPRATRAAASAGPFASSCATPSPSRLEQVPRRGWITAAPARRCGPPLAPACHLSRPPP